MNRRAFLHVTALAAADASMAAEVKMPHIATNTYPWGTFAKREGKTFPLHTDESLAAIAAAGISGYEPIISKPEEFDGIEERLRAHGLDMRSLYVNSSLHDEAQAAQSMQSVLAIARSAAEIGVKIIVTNPSPIRWGGPEDKTDAQLLTQSAALNRLGTELRRLGLTLAYHNHDAELHLRQSRGGKWSEVFTAEGDIDYTRLKRWLDQKNLQPHLSLEQAVEPGSPHTLDVIAAHQQSLRNAVALFAA